MAASLLQVLDATDSLFPTPPQQKQLLDYAKGLPRRFAAARAVEQAEGAVAADALARWGRAHPELGDPADLGWPTADTDLRLVLRAAVAGLLMDDPAYPEARAAGTVRRVLRYADVPAAAAAALFADLRAAAEAALPPAAFADLAPFLPAASPDPVPA